MKICGMAKHKKYDEIAKMLRAGGSRNAIAKRLHVHKDMVRIVDLMMRAYAGDTSVHADLYDLADRRKQHNGKGKHVIGGTVIKTVAPYRCPECGCEITTTPCLGCLSRRNAKHAVAKDPPSKDDSGPIRYELDPEQEAIRQEILRKRGMECVEPILEYGGL